ncbi:MAG: choice-of-anchor D domain-containing protein [Betaproteobacteria bacterium]|nr:choice-of-anchor D domain-containing protein [Betaproteobacteria bacterium]
MIRTSAGFPSRWALALLAVSMLGMTPQATAAVCQFNQTMGSWNVPANWDNCSGGNGSPAGTPGPADRAEITTGRTAIVSLPTTQVNELFLQNGTVQGSGFAATAITTGAGSFVAWGAGLNSLAGVSLQLGTGAGIDFSAGALNLNNAILVTNGGTTTVGVVNVSGAGSEIVMTGGTAYRAVGNHTFAAGTKLRNTSGVFTAFATNVTLDGIFENGGNLEIPAGNTLNLTQAAGYSHTSGVFSLIFGGGTINAPGQVLQLAMGGVRGSPGAGLTFVVGTLHSSGAILRPAPGFGMIGLINVNGNLSLTGSAAVDFNLIGTAPTQYDRILVSGNANLGGNLIRQVFAPFAPPVGTFLDIITAGSVIGTFSGGSEGISFDAPRRFLEQYTATQVRLRANETVWVVDTNDDLMPTLPSLRNALTRFNAESGGGCVNGPYSIHFLLPMGQTTIQPGTPLPVISGCTGLVIDGYTQSGTAVNSSATDWNGNLVVNLDGTACPGCDGIVVQAPNTVIKGINFANWTGGLRINPAATGTSAGGNYFFQNGFGVYHDGAAGTLIGGPALDNRNVFVHSTTAGIATLNSGGASLSVQNNLIGAGAGLTPGPNVKGVHILNTNVAQVQNNIIVFNQTGIAVDTGSSNLIQNNKIADNTVIGIDLNGDGPTPNDDAASPYDTDNGGNRLLNFPVISTIAPTGMTTGDVNFTLKSSGSSNFNVCFCVNATGGNQCRQEVACTPVATDATGLFTGAFGVGGMTPGVSTVTAYTRALTGPKAGNTSEFSPAVTFTTAAPAVSITGSGTFPSTTVLTSSAVQTLTITNSGMGTLTINGISNSGAPVFVDTTSGPAPNAAHYCGFGSNATGQANTGMPVNIAPMGTCVLNLIFAPGALGPASGVLSIVSNATGSPHTVMLTGTGMAAAAPVFSPSATMFTFPGQTVGTTSGAQTLTITNTGGTNLTVAAPIVAGPYGISANSCVTVAPMGSCTIDFTFTPPFSGAFSGGLSLTTNAAGSPHMIAINGNGLLPTTTYAPATLNFGSVVQGVTSASQPVTFTNTSPVTISLSSISFTGGGAGFGVLGSSQCLMAPTLSPMASCTFDVTATPNALGALTDTVYVNTMPANQSTPLDVMLNVTGVAPATPLMTVSVAPMSVITGVNATLTITLNNPGPSPASIVLGSAVTVTGLTMSGLTDSCSLGAFISTGTVDLGMAGVIPAMATCTVTVQVQSAAAGMRTVTVSPGNLVTNRGNNANTSSATLTVTAAPTGPFAYIPIFTGFTGSTVSVIDLPTNTLATTINVGTGPVGAAVNPAGTRAYISNQQSNSVSVIDTATNTVVATVPVGSQPGSAAVNPAGTRVYVPNQTSNSVSVIDTSSNTVTATVTGITFPSSAVVNPAGSKVYVTASSGNALAVIDTGTNAVIGTIPVCAGPYQPVVNGSGTRIYVVCTSGNVSVIDAGSGTVVATVPVGSNPRGIALTPNGAQAWVSNSGTNNVSVIDTATNMVSATLAAGTTPWGVAGNAAGTRMYVSNNGSNNVSVFDTGSNTIVATVPVGVGPVAIGQFLQPAAATPSPVLARSLTTVPFGTRTVSTTSPATVVTIGNSGTANLIISGITAAGDFGFTTTCPISTPPIVPLGTCTISITFTPLTAATLSGTITITSNAPGSPHTIALTGTGVPLAVPAIAVPATSYNLGNAVVGVASAPASIVVTNTGLATLNLTAITVTGAGFARTTPPSVTPMDCGASVAPGNSCQIAVACTAAALGTLMGQLSITHNATGSPKIILLTCTGIAQPLAVISLPASIDFGDQVVNTPSMPRAVTITNAGNASLSVSSATLGGTHAAQFALTGNCSSIPAGAACTLQLTFTPTSTGAKVAAILVVSDAQNAASASSIALTGNGVLAPRPIASPSVTAIGFGNTIFGGAAPMQLFSLKNEGGLSMTIASIVAVGDYTQMNNCGGSLAAQASCTINVAFNPLGLGSRSGELQIFTNAQGSPHRVLLSGTGCRWFSQPGSRFFLTAC